MSEDRGRLPTIQFSVTERFLDRVDAIAERGGERRNDWARRVLVAAVDHAEAAQRMREEAERRLAGGGAP